VALKQYQERAIQTVRQYLEKLAKEQAKGNKHASLDAWEALRDQHSLIGNYRERKNALGVDLPNFYLKVPTGGGKTLMAAQVLGLIHQTILNDRNGTGLVLSRRCLL
jgi:type III restriction enzyme